MPTPRRKPPKPNGPWSPGFPGCLRCPRCRGAGDPFTHIGLLWWGVCRRCGRPYAVEQSDPDDTDRLGRPKRPRKVTV